jgi:hypothetical protein
MGELPIRNSGPESLSLQPVPSLWSCVMFSSPSIVPDSDDHDIYLVLDDFAGQFGRAWREADEDRVDREIIITDLMTGQYCNPVRVVAFNTAEGWSRDVTRDIADELAKWFSEQSREIPPSLEDFIQRHRTAMSEQLPLPLKGATKPNA